MSSFTHLHVHTEYSLLDGVNRTYELFDKVKQYSMDSIAITDHGVLYGVPEFFIKSKDFGVKPIIGCEIYLSPKEMTLKQDVDGIKYYHLLLLAKNKIGYRNLLNIVSLGQLKGMYYKPRVDIETLKKHSEGLICTSACLAGPLSRHIIRNQLPKAEEWLQTLHSIFKEDFYLEIQRNGLKCKDEIDHEAINALPEIEKEETLKMLTEQIKVNTKLYEYADQYKIKIIATTDAHYLNAEDKDVQKVLFCIKDGKTLDDQTSMNGYLETYIKSPEELLADFSDIPEVLEETMVISEKIEAFDIKYDRVQPKFWNLPENISAGDELKKEVYEGALKKYPPKSIIDHSNNLSVDEIKSILDPELVKQLDYELSVIHDKGFDDYFLVVSDIMKWSAKVGILTGVRGSVAGSVAAHCLDIVEVDPIAWQLYFERFLNPERPSPPDIDMDIQDSRRDELIDYVKEKYGEESVAAICAIGRLKTKAAIRDVSRVMGIDLVTADKLSKMVTVLFGKPFKFKQMMETDPEFKRIVEADDRLIELGKVVSKVEGLSRHMSVHACGHLITPGRIVDFSPLQFETGGNRVITQWEGPWIEEVGLMKFDFLGLRTLSIISDTLTNIKKYKEKDINFYTIPNHDDLTFKLFGKGETVGVFQFESPPMQKYLIDLQPENQEDLCFLAAAYRPGPMQYIPDYIKRKHGEQEVKYLTPELEGIIGYTYGFAIYQEQVIKIAVDLAGYSMGGADILRRAMGKKKKEIMEKEEIIFKEGVLKNGMSSEIADGLWKYLLPFADYGFNKAHAAGYAVLAYKCAYLKAHFPLEFMAALLHADLENLDRTAINIKEARRLGFSVTKPDINVSDIYFTPEGGQYIRFGLGAIKNVGVKLCELIIEERSKNGRYTSLDDFVSRVGSKNINKRSLECLIKVGAFDEFGERNGLIKIIPEVFENVDKDKKAKELGQTGFFLSDSVTDNLAQTRLPTSLEPASDKEKMSWEKELLGIYVSSHPIEVYKWTELLRDFQIATDIKNLRHGTKVKIVGIFSTIKITHTKKDNQRMAIVGIEDLSGSVDAVLFPKTFEEMSKKELVTEGRAYVIEGSINIRDDRRSLVIETIEPANTLIKPKKIKISLIGVTDTAELSILKSAFSTKGDVQVEIDYGSKTNRKTLVKNIDSTNDEVLRTIRKYIT